MTRPLLFVTLIPSVVLSWQFQQFEIHAKMKLAQEDFVRPISDPESN